MSEKQRLDCSGSYEVSGYTTDKGKKVDSYIRNCWKHGGSASGGNVQNTRDNIEKTNEKLDEMQNGCVTPEDRQWLTDYIKSDEYQEIYS